MLVSGRVTIRTFNLGQMSWTCQGVEGFFTVHKEEVCFSCIWGYVVDVSHGQ